MVTGASCYAGLSSQISIGGRGHKDTHFTNMEGLMPRGSQVLAKVIQCSGGRQGFSLSGQYSHSRAKVLRTCRLLDLVQSSVLNIVKC